MSRRKTHIYSIFGQIDKCVAEAMAAEGKVWRIEHDEIPPTALYDDHGRRAYFAIIMSDEYLLEYDQRVRNLRP